MPNPELKTPMTPEEQQQRLLHISGLQAAYADGDKTPADVIREVYRRIREYADDSVWITLVPEDEALEAAHALGRYKDKDEISRVVNDPLWGIPFAVKDNIDVAGIPTTAGCSSFSYMPDESAPVVKRLLDAGAILIGKTNLDQFATGLVGTRSPYGACSCVFDEEYISGGSSSGSAVAVAAGLVSFALGTDTAGSGRVPAAFNNIVGMKPTRGIVSTRGVVPACRTLDCVTIFATTSFGASQVLEAIDEYDERDPYSRPERLMFRPSDSARGLEEALARCRAENVLAPLRVGILSEARRARMIGEDERALYEAAADRFRQAGAEVRESPYSPFAEIASLLYSGPWVAERYAAVGEFLERDLPDMDPTVREIILGGKRMSAVDAFRAQYKLAELLREAATVWDTIDVFLLPTAPQIYTHAEIAEDPIGLNSRLGTFTNFVNLANLSAVAYPAGFTPDGLPFGVTLVAPAYYDAALLEILGRIEELSRESSNEGATVAVAVLGAHLTGQPLNHQLTTRGATLARATRTAKQYRFYALSDSVPAKPGLIREDGFDGPGIEVEVWRMPVKEFGSFVAAIPAPLGIGTVELEDGSSVKGFLCEPAALRNAREITELGAWRTYLATLPVS